MKYFIHVDCAPFSVKEFCEKYAEINKGEKETEEILSFDGKKYTFTKDGLVCEGVIVWPWKII